eukprot:3224043-Rhodomonas_salina.4
MTSYQAHCPHLRKLDLRRYHPTWLLRHVRYALKSKQIPGTNCRGKLISQCMSATRCPVLTYGISFYQGQVGRRGGHGNGGGAGHVIGVATVGAERVRDRAGGGREPDQGGPGMSSALRNQMQERALAVHFVPALSGIVRRVGCGCVSDEQLCSTAESNAREGTFCTKRAGLFSCLLFGRVVLKSGHAVHGQELKGLEELRIPSNLMGEVRGELKCFLPTVPGAMAGTDIDYAATRRCSLGCYRLPRSVRAPPCGGRAAIYGGESIHTAIYGGRSARAAIYGGGPLHGAANAVRGGGSSISGGCRLWQRKYHIRRQNCRFWRQIRSALCGTERCCAVKAKGTGIRVSGANCRERRLRVCDRGVSQGLGANGGRGWARGLLH